jgi:hypothetical protein
MAVTYEKNKTHIYKYVSNNREKINEINRKSMAKAYLYKKEVMRLLKIIF